MTQLKILAAGKAKQTPDQMEITIFMDNLYNSYQGAFNASNLAYEGFIKEFKKAGFDEQQLFLESYGIDERYEYVEDKRQFLGYQYRYRLRHLMDLDLERYQKLLKVASNLDSKPTLDLDYTLKDREALQLRAIEDAIKKGYKQAEFIAKTLNKKVAKLVRVDLRNEPQFIYHENAMMKSRSAFADLAIAPIESAVELALDFELEA